MDLRPDRAAARDAVHRSPGAAPRGLSWSDFAVLFRSVSKDADALVAELRRRSIPYVIKGLTRLFDAPEVQACVACFQYILQEVSADDVVDAWLAADVGVSRASLAGGAADPGGGAELAAGRALGHLQHPADLPAVPRSARHQGGDGAVVRRRRRVHHAGRAGLLQPRQVQPGDLRLRADLLPVRAAGEVRRVREVARLPGARLLRRERRRRGVRDPGRGDDRDRAPGQGDAVACGVRARRCGATGSRRRGRAGSTCST